jgi:hypothetical protein
MAQYYQGAWLTIAATTTTAGGGLIQKFDIASLPRITRLPYRDKKGIAKGYFYLQCTANVEDLYDSDVANSELLRRGWVYQERLLSRRLLTFAKTGSFLSCRSAHPRYVTGEKVWSQGLGRYLDEGQLRETIRTARLSDQREWMGVVAFYSRLELSHEEDRLKALSGLAAEFDSAIKLQLRELHFHEGVRFHEYLCGHWYPHLLTLLWEPTECSIRERRRVRGFPTWSWASMALKTEKNTLLGMPILWPTELFSIGKELGLAKGYRTVQSTDLPTGSRSTQKQDRCVDQCLISLHDSRCSACRVVWRRCIYMA